MFYLVMPKDQAGALTDESSTDEIKDSDICENHEIPNMSSTSFFDEEEQETPCLSPTDQSLPDNLCQGEELGQSQVSTQQHVIKNVDEIFNTIEELMRKLNHLRVKPIKTCTHNKPHTKRYSLLFSDMLLICRTLKQTTTSS